MSSSPLPSPRTSPRSSPEQQQQQQRRRGTGGNSSSNERPSFFSLLWKSRKRHLQYGLIGVGVAFFLVQNLKNSSSGSSDHSQDESWLAGLAGNTTVSESLLTLAALQQQQTSNKTNKASSSAEQSHVNRPKIQRHMAANQSFWGQFQQTKLSLPSQNNTATNQSGRTAMVDITRNLARIEDFLQATDSAANGDSAQKEQQQQEQRRNQQQQQQSPNNRPLNIVLFYADDWTMQVLGALNPHVKTPNIDAMAERGMLFTRNCVTTSICWISRNTLATGVYAAVHKSVKIASDNMFNKTLPWLQTLYPLLKRHGYFTGLVGKWHAPSPQPFMKKTFDRMRFYYGSHWMKRDGRQRHVTDLNGEDALAFLRTRPKARPFSLTVSFFATHAVDGHAIPYQPMNESLHLYVNDTIPQPKTGCSQKHLEALPFFLQSPRNEGRRRCQNRFDTPEHYQEKIKHLYRMATEVDAVVGAVIDELKQQGVYNQTLIVFTTDNGNLHGEHGLAEKWYPFEESIRVPLVIEDPRMAEHFKGTRNDEFTLSVDLAPTLLSAAQIRVPAFMQGRDIAQLYTTAATSSSSTSDDNTKTHEDVLRSWRQDFFYEWNQGEAVTGERHNHGMFSLPAVFALIRKDYKYFYWPQAKMEQLFHIEQDPFEERDIFKSNVTTTQQALTLMRERYRFLKQWAQLGNPV